MKALFLFALTIFPSISFAAEAADPWSNAFPSLGAQQSEASEITVGAALGSGLAAGTSRFVKKEIQDDALELAREELLKSDKNYHKLYYARAGISSMEEDFASHFEGKPIASDAKIFGFGPNYAELQKKKADFSAKYSEFLAERDQAVKSRAAIILADLKAGRKTPESFAAEVKEARKLHLFVAPLYAVPAYMIFSGMSRLNQAVKGVESGYTPAIDEEHASVKIPPAVRPAAIESGANTALSAE